MKKILPIILSVVITAVVSSAATYLVTVEVLDNPADKNDSSYSKDNDTDSGNSSTGYELQVIDQSVTGTPEQSKFEIKSAVVEKKSDGTDVVLVTYVYTRLSGEAESFSSATDSRVYQNGVALDTTTNSELEKKYNFDYSDDFNDVKSGYSAEITEMFKIKDKSSNLVVEVCGKSWGPDNDYAVSKTFKMK